MRTVLTALLLLSVAHAQPAGTPPEPRPSLPTGDPSADKTLFRRTVPEPEEAFLAEVEAGRRRMNQGEPLYRRYEGLGYVTEAAAGLFGAGIVGLVGASIGDAIAPGDNGQALGGASGRAFGLLGGAYLGSSMGVWGASRLFEKPVHPGWAFLGSGLGTLVGGGAATGILFALQDDKQTAGGLAVASVFLFQVAGAVLFTEVGMPDTGVLGQPTR